MRCAYQCHEIGGPWIAENPDCPTHGYEARQREKWADEEKQELEDRLSSIEARLKALESR